MRRVLMVATGVGPGQDRLRTMLLLLAAMVLLAACATSAPPTGTRSLEASPTQTPSPQAGDAGAVIIEKVMRAWTSGSEIDIEAAYAPSAVIASLDKSVVANNREEAVELIQGSVTANTWRHIGPPAAYPGSFNRLFVTTMVEVTGQTHPAGDPIIFIFVVRDGQVVKQLMVDPKLDL